MPSFRNFSVTIGANVNQLMPKITISAQVIDDNKVTVLADLTGNKSVDFATIIRGLPADYLSELMTRLANELIYKSMGR